jgi:rhamnose transport system permease protein
MSFVIRRFRPEQIRELFLVVLIVLVVVFFSIEIEGYFNARFVNRISTSVVVVAILAVGQTLVFLTRNFDLSTGSIVGFTAYFVGQQLWHHPEIPPLAAVALAIGVGMFMGAINGVLIAYGRVPSIITTIATLAIYRSFLVEYSHAVPITTNNLPDWIVNLPPLSLFSVGEVEFRLIFAIMVLVVVVFQLLLNYLPFGRRLYAIGSNPDAARVAGFPAQRIVFIAFLLSGGLAGLAGFIFLARFGNISVLAGIGLEFASIAAVVVGGVSNMGGSGTVFGAFLGALLIDLLENSLFRWQARAGLQMQAEASSEKPEVTVHVD